MAVVSFGPFELNLDNSELYRSGILVRLQPQPAKLLVLLVRRAGEVVTREEIRDRLWGHDTFVDFDQSVNFCVRQVRNALHDHASTPCYLETLPRRGYRFIGPVACLPSEADPPARPPLPVPSRRDRLVGLSRMALITTLLAIVAAASYRPWTRATSSGDRSSSVAVRPLSGLPDATPTERCGTAHAEVQLGRFFLDKFSAEGMDEAVGHFQSALRRNPDCALAYAGLAEAYNQQASVFLSLKSPADARLSAIRAATRAIQLDPTLAEAHATLGYATMHEMDWDRAGVALRRAIELNPRYVVAREIHAAYLADQRRFPEAIDEARRAVELAPASARTRRVLAWMLYFAREYDPAIRELRTILRMEPAYAWGHFTLGQVLLASGQATQAVPELEHAVELAHRAPAPVGLLAMAYGASGRHGDAQRLRDELEARAATGYVAPGALLLGYIGVGDTARAVDMVVRGYDERDNYEVNIVVDPLMDPLRGDPRFEEVSQHVMRGSALDPRKLATDQPLAAR